MQDKKIIIEKIRKGAILCQLEISLKPGSKYNMPIFIPRFLVSNFALVLLAITLYSFNLYRTHVSGFDNLNYLVVIFLISICVIIVFYVTTKLTKIPAFIISSTSMCLVAYSNLILKKLSINEMFTDIDIYQYQYPLSIFQFNQVQDLDLFYLGTLCGSWNCSRRSDWNNYFFFLLTVCHSQQIYISFFT